MKCTYRGSLYVENGSVITAAGTTLKPVLFTSANDASAGGDSVLNDANKIPDSGDWSGMIIESESVGSQFSHCTFSYGGSGKYAVLKIEGRASVENCTFRDNLGGHPYDGSAEDTATLDASLADESTVITGNLFYRNTWPLSIGCSMNLDATNSFSFDEDGDPGTTEEENDHQGIFIDYGNISTTVEWDETEVPLCFFGMLVRVTPSGTLTVNPGTVIKSSGAEFIFEYGAHVNSTGVIFTSFRDDTLLGDTNCDASASGPSNGDWTGIGVLDSDDNLSWLTRDNSGSIRDSSEG